MQDICYNLHFDLKKSIFCWHFWRVVALYRKFTGAIVLHCVKFQPKQTSIIEMRAKIVRQIKCCLRRVKTLVSETGLFFNSLSYDFYSHFFDTYPIELKL